MTDDDEVTALAEQVKLIFAGQDNYVQGVVLADALAIWLAGHFIRGDPAATLKLRKDLLTNHLRVVRKLTVVYAKIMRT